MNQTLQNTKLAGAITAMALLCGLLLAEPVGQPARSQSGPAILAAGGHAVGELGRGLARDLDLRSGRFEADMAAAGPAGEALAIASAAVATSVVDSTVSALLEDFGARTVADSSQQHEARPARAVRSRSAMAMPYFAAASAASRGIGE